MTPPNPPDCRGPGARQVCSTKCEGWIPLRRCRTGGGVRMACVRPLLAVAPSHMVQGASPTLDQTFRPSFRQRVEICMVYDLQWARALSMRLLCCTVSYKKWSACLSARRLLYYAAQNHLDMAQLPCSCHKAFIKHEIDGTSSQVEWHPTDSLEGACRCGAGWQSSSFGGPRGTKCRRIFKHSAQVSRYFLHKIPSVALRKCSSCLEF